MVNFRNRRVRRGWIPLKVKEIIDVCSDTRTIKFVEEDCEHLSFDYIPGQYMSFRFDDLGPKPLVRSYTISSCPKDSELWVTVKEVPQGRISHYFCREIKVGDVLRARGAMGRFIYEPAKDYPNLVLIGGGSGVTPFLSMVRQYYQSVLPEETPESLSLVFSYRNRMEIIGHEEIELAEKSNYISVVKTLSRDNFSEGGFSFGRIDQSMLDRAVGHRYEDKTYMLCGPQDLMNSAAQLLKDQGVSGKHIKTESFEN